MGRNDRVHVLKRRGGREICIALYPPPLAHVSLDVALGNGEIPREIFWAIPSAKMVMVCIHVGIPAIALVFYGADGILGVMLHLYGRKRL
ncbi:hypothetical protein CEXT_477071 [Caerostris extrusa]|uniref:Uncharacterized protein n=1 Tax=Caerostris extrusa TaxID=172846 RepID=A0AAV4XZP5_CAEEX|nr:hypothetical protein CEXT_477071 [Caerostris extrusa]